MPVMCAVLGESAQPTVYCDGRLRGESLTNQACHMGLVESARGKGDDRLFGNIMQYANGWCQFEILLPSESPL